MIILSGDKKPQRRVEVWRDPCRMCGGRMLRVDVVQLQGQATVKCEKCGHGAKIVQAVTAEAKMQAMR